MFWKLCIYGSVFPLVNAMNNNLQGIIMSRFEFRESVTLLLAVYVFRHWNGNILSHARGKRPLGRNETQLIAWPSNPLPKSLSQTVLEPVRYNIIMCLCYEFIHESRQM